MLLVNTCSCSGRFSLNIDSRAFNDRNATVTQDKLETKTSQYLLFLSNVIAKMLWQVTLLDLSSLPLRLTNDQVTLKNKLVFSTAQ